MYTNRYIIYNFALQYEIQNTCPLYTYKTKKPLNYCKQISLKKKNVLYNVYYRYLKKYFQKE